MQNNSNLIVEHKTLMTHFHIQYVTKHKGVSTRFLNHVEIFPYYYMSCITTNPDI